MPKPTPEAQQVFDKLDPKYKAVIDEFHLRCQARNPVSIDDFTCANCPIVSTCVLAFDLYNLDGDCLADK